MSKRWWNWTGVLVVFWLSSLLADRLGLRLIAETIFFVGLSAYIYHVAANHGMEDEEEDEVELRYKVHTAKCTFFCKTKGEAIWSARAVLSHGDSIISAATGPDLEVCFEKKGESIREELLTDERKAMLGMKEAS